MYQAIVFLPLLGFLIAGLFGRQLGARPSEIVTTALLFISALLAWSTFISVGYNHAPMNVPVVANWISSGTLKIDWA